MKSICIKRVLAAVCAAVCMWGSGLHAQIINCIDTSIIDSSVNCTAVFSPVCGCDGVTYPNACVATNYAGVQLLAIGPCSINCNADFSFAFSNLCSATGKCVQFTDQSTNNVISWNWSFGDGTTSNVQSPNHVYTAPGKYAVCLSVLAIGPQGLSCTDTYCDTLEIPCLDPSSIDTTAICPLIYAPVCGCNGVTYSNACIAVNYGGVCFWTQGVCPTPTCEADFTVSQNIPSICTTQGKCVQFIDQSSNNITSWVWTFGDGSGSTAQNPVHAYAAPGDYVVCLSVLGVTPSGLSCTDTYCDTITINCVNPGQIDTTAICPAIFDPVCGCNGVTYPNACVAFNYGGVCFWTPGPCSQPCDADFSWVRNNAQTFNGNNVDFTDLSTGANIGYSWDFGDGSTSNDPNPSHVYATPGRYEVCLTINCFIGPIGAIDQYCDTIRVGCKDSSLVNALPCPSIFDPVCGCDGQTYPNGCIARNNGVTTWIDGPCSTPYCPSYSQNSNVGWIQSVGPVVTGNNGGYNLLSFCNFTFDAGETVLIPLKAGINNPPANAVPHWRVWVDYNQDDDFGDAGELAWQSIGILNPTAVVTIDINACLGCTRFRFQLSEAFQGPCGPYGFGETEDYNLTILNDIACKHGSGISDVERNPFINSVAAIDMKLSPNPASSVVNLNLNLQDAVQEDIEVTIYDINGKVMRTMQYDAMSGKANIAVPVDQLANGIYQVAVTTSGQQLVERLVIAR